VSCPYLLYLSSITDVVGNEISALNALEECIIDMRNWMLPDKFMINITNLSFYCLALGMLTYSLTTELFGMLSRKLNVRQT